MTPWQSARLPPRDLSRRQPILGPQSIEKLEVFIRRGGEPVDELFGFGTRHHKVVGINRRPGLFEELIHDPAFRAEAEKANLNIVPLTGREAELLEQQTVGTSLHIIEKVQAASAVRDAMSGNGRR